MNKYEVHELDATKFKGDFGTIDFVPVKSCSEEDIQEYKNGLGGIIEIIYEP